MLANFHREIASKYGSLGRRASEELVEERTVSHPNLTEKPGFIGFFERWWSRGNVHFRAFSQHLRAFLVPVSQSSVASNCKALPLGWLTANLSKKHERTRAG
jgi:hypothetical protein